MKIIIVAFILNIGYSIFKLELLLIFLFGFLTSGPVIDEKTIDTIIYLLKYKYIFFKITVVYFKLLYV